MHLKSVTEKFDKFIPEPKDIYEAVELLHVVGQIVGLAPYKTIRNEDGTKIYQPTIWTLGRCIILLFCYIAFIIFLISMREHAFGIEVQEQLQRLLDYFTALISIVSILFACIFSSKVLAVFRYLDEIDHDFQGLAVWMPYKRTFIIITANTVAVFLFGLGTFIWILTLYCPEDLNEGTILEIAGFMPFLLVGFLMETQYFHYMNLLRHRYFILNEYLEALARENNTYNGWVSEKFQNREEANKFSRNISKSIEVISNPILVTEKVISLRIKLSDTVMLINTSFSVQLLLRITIAFIAIVTALYMIGVNFSNPDTLTGNLNVNIMFTTWAGCSVLELMTMVWITNATCEEANKCPRLMHKIRNTTKNTKIQDVIEMYSLQMYHNRLQFYICGLFPLDYTLLHTIVAGVTTYLVILIQFNGAGSNNHENLKNNSSY